MKGEEALALLLREQPAAKVRFRLLDLASLRSIRAFADGLKGEQEGMDLLLNNAGVMALPRRQVTEDGFERQLAVNCLGPFALTGLLLPLLRQGRAARVVNVSSVAHRLGEVVMDNLQAECGYDPTKAYAQSKLALLLFAFELQRRSRSAGWGIESLGVNPGWVPGTSLYSNGPGSEGRLPWVWRFGLWLSPRLSNTVVQGAESLLYGALSPDAHGGAYYGPTGFCSFKGKPGLLRHSRRADSLEKAMRLWERFETLTGVQYGI